MAGRDKEPEDLDAQLRAETERLLKEMDELMRRARVILGDQHKALDQMREEREKLRNGRDRRKKPR